MAWTSVLFGAPSDLDDARLVGSLPVTAVVRAQPPEAGRHLRWCELLKTQARKASAEATVEGLARAWGSVVVAGGSDRGGLRAFLHRHECDADGEVRTTHLVRLVDGEAWDLDGDLEIPEDADQVAFVLAHALHAILGGEARLEFEALRRALVGGCVGSAVRVAPGVEPAPVAPPADDLPHLVEVWACEDLTFGLDEDEEEDELLAVRLELGDAATREAGLARARALRARGEMGAASAEIATLRAAGRWAELAEAARSWAEAVDDERAGMAIAWTAHALARNGDEELAVELIRVITARIPALTERIRRQEDLAGLVR